MPKCISCAGAEVSEVGAQLANIPLIAPPPKQTTTSALSHLSQPAAAKPKSKKVCTHPSE